MGAPASQATELADPLRVDRQAGDRNTSIIIFYIIT